MKLLSGITGFVMLLICASVVNSVGTNLPQGLITYYGFNNSYDDSLGTRHLSAHENTSFVPDRFCNPNGGLHLADNAYAADPDPNFNFNWNSAFAVTAWVRFDDLIDGFQTVFACEPHHPATPKFSWVVAINMGKLGFGCGKPGSRWFHAEYPMESLTEGLWYHIAGVYNNQTILFYLNGVPVDTSWYEYMDTESSISNWCAVGATATDLAWFLKGDIDEIGIYDRALSDSEITTLASFYGYMAGDANGDGKITVGDAVYIVSYIFRSGLVPVPLNAGDPNGDCKITVGDAVYIVNYIFRGGPAPQCGCVEGMRTCCSNEDAPGASDKAAFATMTTIYDGEKTMVTINSPEEIYGLQIEVKGDDGAEVINQVEQTQLYHQWNNGEAMVGILDINGVGRIPAGETTVLTIAGEATVMSAIGADVQGQTIEIAVGEAAKTEPLPTQFALHQNRPNPFNPTTEISFSLPRAADVTLEVYNITGQRITTLVSGHLEAGSHTVVWNGKDETGRTVSSGIYLYRVKAGEYVETKKMVLLK